MEGPKESSKGRHGRVRRGQIHLSGNRVNQALSNLLLSGRPKTYNWDTMRILVGCLLVASASVFLTQSYQEFHSRYGEPDMERFTARPGISVAVEYGSDRLACQVLIEPPDSLIHQEEQARLMSSEGASQVLEEVAPVATRGNKSIHLLILADASRFTGLTMRTSL
jgi:hypothetical protein